MVEATELGGVVFFLTGDGSSGVASTGWFSWMDSHGS
jgi:hypothetical protein